jgi:23S rRNA (guanosine2251-2'-O)-methyltransferase
MSQLIGGRHAVFHALKARRRSVKEILYQEGLKVRSDDEISLLAKKQGVAIRVLDKRAFNKKSLLETHQGVLAHVADLPMLSLEELCAKKTENGESRLLMLDGIEDPHNLGALLRSAQVLGLDGAIWSRRGCAPLSAVAVKAAAGAVEYLPLCLVGNLAQSIKSLKEAAYWIYGSVISGGMPLAEQDFGSRSVLLVGGEGKGLKRIVAEACDITISIPCSGPIGSLNASVAGGIMMSYFASKNSVA